MYSDLKGGTEVASECAPGSVSVDMQRTAVQPGLNMIAHGRLFQSEVWQVVMTKECRMLNSPA